MEAEEKNRKKKLDLDWNKLLSRQAGDEEPLPPLVVIKTEPQPRPKKKSDVMGGGGGGDDQSKEEFWENLPDDKLEEKIQRQQRNLECLGSKLPDKGKKIRNQLELLEGEKRRRTLSRAKMDADGCDKPVESPSSDIVGSSNVFGQRSKSHQAFSQSTLGTSFSKRMEENPDCRTVNIFEKSLLILDCSEHRKTRCNGEFSQSERLGVRKSPRWINLQHHRKPSFGDQNGRTVTLSSLCDTDDDLRSIAKCNEEFSQSERLKVRKSPRLMKSQHPSFCDQKGRSASLSSLCDTDDDLPSIAKKNANDSRCRQGQTVVVDKEEPQLVKTLELEVKLPKCKKDARIYYPSRDDPECVEICFGDIDSLAPETFLTSQIMNFYIRYLQQQASPTNRAICDYHFFNTYFYQKLKEAVSSKGSDKDALFIKFRRWWKGVNIFQKAYLLIPINEDYHWSLVIICIPDMEDGSGPIILHLDSLGLHSSRLIFKNIKSYLREEWYYLNQEVAPSDLPIADKKWQNLPCRIDEKTIDVPQQKNDYDCGLFVLFFMERFIEKAPERLKKKDLAMFGKQWFGPEGASGLRRRIRNLLIEQFRSASEDMGGSQSSPSS